MKTHAHIVGWGKYVPQRVLTNDDLAEKHQLTAPWVAAAARRALGRKNRKSI